MESKFPPYLLEILWNRLLALGEEQAQVLMRTAFSTIVREAGDLSAAVFDRRGRMVAQARTGTPGHVNTMARGMRSFLEEFPIDSIEPGDVLLSNDPYKLAGQLNDMCLVTPVFRNTRCVGLFASCCHMVDVGGVGLTADARNVFEEGLQVPFCKFLIKGQENRDVVRFIRTNVRTPKEVIGDLYAQVAAGEVGARRLVQMIDEFGLEDIEDLADEIINRSEKAVREAVAAFPEGRFQYACENDGFEEPLHIAVDISKQGGDLVIDFDGTVPSIDRGINVPLAYTTAYSCYAVKCVVAPDVPNNEGSFLPFIVRAPRGSLLNPVHPSPTAARHIIGHFLPSVVFGALEKALPEKVPADSAAGLWVTQLSGFVGPEEPFAFAFFSCGGMGARREKDGLSATSFPSGIQNVATEIIESSSPVVMRQRELLADSGGAGRYRGGLGQEIRFEVHSHGACTLSAMYDRVRFPPRGIHGGKSGGAGAVLGGDGRGLPSKGRITIQSGEQITLHLPGGGGFGDPRERARDAIEADVQEGYLTVAESKRVYG
ncbi:MAG: hydantoinase B/oxoprolinase family protein [Burkholderiales bacterium]|nr:hydantoinase B/oxoprolinase family protein [Burkholderiales bacterium]